jgi:RNA polymerase sigma factor (sigma-70 family)
MGGERERSDAELLAAAASDPDAFAAFYRRYERGMAAFLRRRTGSAELAADLASEVFAAVLVACHRGMAPKVRGQAWLYGIAQHKLIDSYRRGQVEDEARRRLGMRPVVISDRSLERIEALVGDTPALELVQDLPVEQRDAITARVIDERDYGEIASELGLSEQVIRKRVSRGLGRLREVMGGRPR